MKPNNFLRKICILFATSCVLCVAFHTTPSSSALYAQHKSVDDFYEEAAQVEVETPGSIEELLNDPLFNIDADATEKDVLDAANQLKWKYVQLCDSIMSEHVSRVQTTNKEEVAKEKEKKRNIEIKQKEYEERFRTKFSDTFIPKLKNIFEDDERACSGDATVNYVLSLFLRYVYDSDEIAAIRLRELERYTRKIQSSDNDLAKKLAFDRLYYIDSAYLRRNGDWFARTDVPEEFFIGMNKDADTILRQRLNISEESRESLVETGDRIASELNGDPLLLSFAERIYRSLLGNDCEEDALALRERIQKIVSDFDPEILEKWKYGGSSYRFPFDNFSVLKEKEDSVDESILTFHITKRQASIANVTMRLRNSPKIMFIWP